MASVKKIISLAKNKQMKSQKRMSEVLLSKTFRKKSRHGISKNYHITNQDSNLLVTYLSYIA
jgi:hypothetical protein